MTTLKVFRTPGNEDVPLPCYGSDGAAGLDLHAAVPADKPWRLNPGDRALVPCGIIVQVPSGHSMDIQPRSGLALKHGITVLNSPGLVDSDYRGEVGVILFNNGAEPFVVRRGDRIAQAVIRKFTKVQVASVDSKEALTRTDRGEGGFGSTGVSAKNT